MENERIINCYTSVDFRQMRECISYANCFIQEMQLDEIRQFRDLIDWNFEIVSFLSKRKDFVIICKEFKKEIEVVYNKWSYDLNELTKEQWKKILY